MISPIMLHQQRLFESYYALASSIVQLDLKLYNILCYGMDKEKNLFKAFGTVFPFAIHLLCDFHMEDNITRKLTDLGIQKSLANYYKKEILGRGSGTVREPGMVDCLTKQDLQHGLDLFCPVWGKKHMKGRQFYEYFVCQKAPLILSCMGAATRMNAGLGYPPKGYSQNDSECGNFILKHCKN